MSGCEHQLPEFHDVRDPPGSKGDEPVQWRCARTQGWRAEQEAGLERGLRVVQQGEHQPGPAPEAAEDGALAHAGLLGQPVHGERGGPALFDQLPGSKQEAFTVPGGVAAFRGRHGGHDRPHWDGPHTDSVAMGNINGLRSV